MSKQEIQKSSMIMDLPYDMYLMISSFLSKSDIQGFIYSCKKMSSLLLWCHDDAGVHICLGCDLTSSMDGAYRNLKQYLLQLLKELKREPLLERTLFSSFWFWDLDRAHDSNEPYLQIQPPAESIIKQERLISEAQISSGGGSECGGIALCELNTQFRNRWISQYVDNFGKSIDVMIMCLDAPFHFIVDTESYYEVTRKHSIKKDWIAAMHDLCNKGVLIIMILINTQPYFKKPLQLMGGFNDALGGISIEVNVSSLSSIPIFVKSIIKEESQKRKIVSDIYKRVAYNNKFLSDDELMKRMNQEMKKVNIPVTCANIPEKNQVKCEDVSNARELAKCKTMKEAIDNGLLESEEVSKRLHYKYRSPMPIACSSLGYQHFQPQNILPISCNDECDDDDIPEIQPLPMLMRLQSECVTSSSYTKHKKSSNKSFELKRQNITGLTSQIPEFSQLCKSATHGMAMPSPVTRQLTFNKIQMGDIESFGLVRKKSAASSYPPKQKTIAVSSMQTIAEEEEEEENEDEIPERHCIIEGSIKCYLKEPNVDFSDIKTPLLDLVNKPGQSSEEKFQHLLLKQSPKQYELYMNGGVLGRFKFDKHQNQPSLSNSATNGLLDDDIPVLSRAFSTQTNSNNRILQFIRSG